MTRRFLAAFLLSTTLAGSARAAQDIPLSVNTTTGQIQRTPSTDTLTFANGATWSTNGTVGLSGYGPGVEANALLTVSTNTIATIPGPATLTQLTLAGADGVASRFFMEGFGSAGVSGSIFQGFGIGGTAISPTATPAGKPLMSFGAGGYDGTNYIPGAAFIQCSAINTWTTSDHSNKCAQTIIGTGVTTGTILWQADGTTLSMAIGGAQGSEAFRADFVTSAVDRIECSGAATANPATVSCLAKGTDTNVNFQIAGLGSGAVQIQESHLSFAQATLPTVTSCGTGSPTVTSGSTDTRGSVTTGTAATTCTVTFKGNAGAGFATAPFCLVDDNSLVISASTTSTSTTTLVIGLSGAGLSGGVVTWHCLQ